MRAKQDRWYALDLDPGLDKALPKLLSLIGVSALVAGVLMYFSTWHWLELMAPALVACSAAAALVLWHTGLGRWSALLMFVGAIRGRPALLPRVDLGALPEERHEAADLAPVPCSS